jgi:hypothetical protein
MFIFSGFGFFLLAIATFAIVIRKQNRERRKHMMDHFDSYIGILNYHMERAYDVIHKDQILIYSLEATRLEDGEFDAATKSFCKLVIKLMGPTLYNEFVFLFGDENTFFFNMTEYFNSRYENDEIRSSALDNIGEDET